VPRAACAVFDEKYNLAMESVHCDKVRQDLNLNPKYFIRDYELMCTAVAEKDCNSKRLEEQNSRRCNCGNLCPQTPAFLLTIVRVATPDTIGSGPHMLRIREQKWFSPED